jgi:hypothetical protein
LHFAEKLRDVVGLYVDPPAHAVVLNLSSSICATSAPLEG